MIPNPSHFPHPLFCLFRVEPLPVLCAIEGKLNIIGTLFHPYLLSLSEPSCSCLSLTSETSTCPSWAVSRLLTVRYRNGDIRPSHLVHSKALKQPCWVPRLDQVSPTVGSDPLCLATIPLHPLWLPKDSTCVHVGSNAPLRVLQRSHVASFAMLSSYQECLQTSRQCFSRLCDE